MRPRLLAPGPRSHPARSRLLLTALLCLAGLLTSSAISRADTGSNWPSWRGPRENGSIESGDFPTRFSPTTGLAWKTALPGKGCSTPIVWDDRIYLTTPVDGQDALLAIDAGGKVLWTTPVGAEEPGKHRNGSGSNPSIVTDGQGLYAQFKSGNLVACDLNGHLRWKVNLVERYGKSTLYWDYGSSPVLTREAVVVAVMHQGESYVAAFAKTDGTVLWKVPRNFKTPVENDHSYATPLRIQHAGREAILVWGAEHLTAHDVANGNTLWSCGDFNPGAKANWVAVSSPVIAGDIAVVPYGRGSRLFGVRLGGSGDVTATHRVWTREGTGTFVPSPIEYRGRIYLVRDRGEVECIDPTDGHTVWNADLPKHSSSYYSSPTIAGGRLYAAREDGVVFVADVRDKFALVSENDMGERIIASPVPFRGGVLLRGEKTLFHAGAGGSSGASGDSGAAITLRSPLDFQVVQRSSAQGGSIPVAGEVVAAPRRADLVEVRWVDSQTGASGAWQRVRVRSGTVFTANLAAPAGGWYRIEARARAGNETIGTASVEHAGVGEIFVVTGQSNSANHGEELQTPKSGLVVTFDGKAWRPANDPQPGASGGGGSFIPPFGDAVAARLKVPVGIVATGVGATSVREWLPRGTRFANPPTLTGNVSQRPDGSWESKGDLFDRLVARMRQLGPGGFRAVLWHQGESDANQKDASRTLPGDQYRRFLEQLIVDSNRSIGWEVPWFVALVSYHTPDDTGSEDIRAAQRALWDAKVALPGPDSDALVGDLRDGGGKGVHFSGKGLREHGGRWADKVAPWIESKLAASTAAPKPSNPPGRLELPGDKFTVAGRPAFLYLPPAEKRRSPQPWIFYAPTLPPYPDQAERWMHEQFLAAGVAVAGVDVGEAYGSPKSHEAFDALYNELVRNRGFARRPCLFGRSRGGLWVTSWAEKDPSRIAGLIGIYPVFDFRTYPGLTNAAPAYGLTPEVLGQRAAELNPIERVGKLAKARIPAVIIHGDIDTVVPLKENSARFKQTYEDNGAGSLVNLIVVKGQGHNFYEGFFHAQPLVDFAIERAKAGAK